MTRGRKPKPAHLKLLQGNPGNRPIHPEIQPTRVLPEPSADLTVVARDEFMRLREELYNCGLLTVLDLHQFEAYCQAYGRWVVAERALARMARNDPTTSGLMIKTQSGSVIQNPLVGTANRAMRDMVAYAAEFGFTPSSRTRIATIGGGGAAARGKFGDLLG